MSDSQDFFANSGGGDRNSASAAFRAIGDMFRGTIAEEPVVIDQTEFGTGNPKLDKNGNVQKQLVVVLQTELRNWDKATNPPKEQDAKGEWVFKPASADTGLRTLYVKFKLRDAIGKALQEAGAKALEVGGELAVAYTEDTTFNGFKVKDYKAQYKAPVAAAAGGDFFGGNADNPPF